MKRNTKDGFILASNMFLATVTLKLTICSEKCRFKLKQNLSLVYSVTVFAHSWLDKEFDIDE